MSDPFHPTDGAHVPSNRASRSPRRRVQQRSRRSRGFPFCSGHACGAPLNGDTGISEGRLLPRTFPVISGMNSVTVFLLLRDSSPSSTTSWASASTSYWRSGQVPSIHAKRPSSTASAAHTNRNSSAGDVTWSPQSIHHWVSDPHACCCANFEQRCNSLSLSFSLSLLQEVDQLPAGVDKQVPSDSTWLPCSMEASTTPSVLVVPVVVEMCALSDIPAKPKLPSHKRRPTTATPVDPTGVTRAAHRLTGLGMKKETPNSLPSLQHHQSRHNLNPDREQHSVTTTNRVCNKAHFGHLRREREERTECSALVHLGQCRKKKNQEHLLSRLSVRVVTVITHKKTA